MQRWRLLTLLFVFALFMVTFMVTVVRIPARAQEEMTASDVQKKYNCIVCIFIPAVFQPFQRIANPLGVTPSHTLLTSRSPEIVDFFTHPEGHIRLWVEGDPSQDGIWNLQFDFNDVRNPDHTYLADYENSSETPILSWWFQVNDESGEDLPTMIAKLRSAGHHQMANRLEDLRRRKAWVRVFQPNRRGAWALGYPVSDPEGFDKLTQYKAELWALPTTFASSLTTNQLLLPLIIKTSDFYTDTADSISGSGFTNRIVKFDEVTSTCVSYDMHFTTTSGSVELLQRENVTNVETKSTGTTVTLKYSWWKRFETVGSGQYSRYMLICRNGSTTNPMWPQ